VTDVHSPFRSSHESSYTTNANSRTSPPPPPPTARATDSDRRTDGRTALFTVRLPITRFEVGIRKTVKVQIPNCYSTDTSLETATARKRYRCSAFVGHRDPMCLDRALTSSPNTEVRVHRDGVLKPSRHWHNQTCRFASHSRPPAAISCLSL